MKIISINNINNYNYGHKIGLQFLYSKYIFSYFPVEVHFKWSLVYVCKNKKTNKIKRPRFISSYVMRSGPYSKHCQVTFFLQPAENVIQWHLLEVVWPALLSEMSVFQDHLCVCFFFSFAYTVLRKHLTFSVLLLNGPNTQSLHLDFF